MAITSMKKVFNIDEEEYGFLAGDQNPMAGGNTISLTCPKVTACLSGTGPDTNNADGIFDNDKACKPSFSKKVNRAKAISCKLEKNGNWLAKLNAEGKITDGTRFTIHFLNGNVNDPYATTR